MNPELNQEPRAFLTVPEAAEYLQISVSAVYRLIKKNRLPAARFGGVIRIPREAFSAWITASTNCPIEGGADHA